MESTPFLAHIAEDGRTQDILSHLKGTAMLAKEFARPFGGEEQAELAGLAHDVGKYSLAFQKRLRGDPAKVDHATAGAAECWRERQVFAAFAVAGHHGGLLDGGSLTDSPHAGTFWGRIQRAEKGMLEPCDGWRNAIRLPQACVPDFALKGKAEATFFIRMLYACLVDADYLDTEAFMAGQPRERNAMAMEQLWEKLQNHISCWFPPRNALNRQRCNILERCIQEGERQPPGLFSLTVPTGGGKTVASLAFALYHAKKYGLRRVIYVVPYTSIIEQTAERFREILGEENVLEHHSNALYELEEADARTVRLARVTENWDMPVIVTTAVQFFESLYACRASQCRKLHNIAGSVVVFDEAQMMPIPYLRPCVHAISQLVAHYRVSAVLCTATQPALEPVFREFLPGVPLTEICPQGTYQGEAFHRVSFRREGKLSWDTLGERLNQLPQALCIVNTRKSARELFERLEGEGRFHLSTLMYPTHRREQLQKIRERLSKGLPCRVVSTSLIEAGVDVDFPAVYREVAGLDSILQAAGRCNREGKRSAAESIVTLFQSEGAIPPLFSKTIGVGKAIMQRYVDLASQDAIHAYFHQLLDFEGSEAQDMQHILRAIQRDEFPFRTIASRFHLIDSPTKTIYVLQGEAETLAARLKQGERSRKVFRQLGQYGVSVYEMHFAALEQAGDLEILEDGTAFLRNRALYSMDTGLSLEVDAGKALFV